MHVHAGAVDFVIFLAYLLIAGLLLRLASSKLSQSDTPLARAIGEGLGAIY